MKYALMLLIMFATCGFAQDEGELTPTETKLEYSDEAVNDASNELDLSAVADQLNQLTTQVNTNTEDINVIKQELATIAANEKQAEALSLNASAPARAPNVAFTPIVASSLTPVATGWNSAATLSAPAQSEGGSLNASRLPTQSNFFTHQPPQAAPVVAAPAVYLQQAPIVRQEPRIALSAPQVQPREIVTREYMPVERVQTVNTSYREVSNARPVAAAPRSQPARRRGGPVVRLGKSLWVGNRRCEGGRCYP